MPRRKVRDIKFKQIQITEDCFNYFHYRKTSPVEPIYNVVDRILNQYTTKDVAGFAEKSDKLERINEIYLQRIHDLESQLKDKKQMRLL